MLWVRISIGARCTTLCDKICYWLATGRWFSPGSPPIKLTAMHDIIEILLKVALNTIKPNQTKLIRLNFQYTVIISIAYVVSRNTTCTCLCCRVYKRTNYIISSYYVYIANCSIHWGNPWYRKRTYVVCCGVQPLSKGLILWLCGNKSRKVLYRWLYEWANEYCSLKSHYYF